MVAPAALIDAIFLVPNAHALALIMHSHSYFECAAVLARQCGYRPVLRFGRHHHTLVFSRVLNQLAEPIAPMGLPPRLRARDCANVSVGRAE